MIKTIFINQNDKINAYLINIKTNKIKRIQNSIDKSYGKGKILTITTSPDFFIGNSNLFGKNIEIISKKYVSTRIHFDYCCAECDTINIYEYKYYAYTPHKLSILCKQLLDSTNSLNLSYTINEILNYKTLNDDEQRFLNKILNSLKFKKIDNIKLLMKFINVLKKETNQDFNNVVEEKINSMQSFNEAFHKRELNNEPLIYTKEEKIKIRKKIISSLPTQEKISTK